MPGPFADELGRPDTAGFASAVAAAVLFFGSILLHELGHAVAARREGIEVNGIDLFFFGGVMKMSRDTDTPGHEFRVAVAGPAGDAADRDRRQAGRDRCSRRRRVLGRRAPGAQRRADRGPSCSSRFLVSLNVLLLVFNLVPAFPLDGGRIARAAAWKLTGDRGKATRLRGHGSARASRC